MLREVIFILYSREKVQRRHMYAVLQAEFPMSVVEVDENLPLNNSLVSLHFTRCVSFYREDQEVFCVHTWRSICWEKTVNKNLDEQKNHTTCTHNVLRFIHLNISYSLVLQLFWVCVCVCPTFGICVGETGISFFSPAHRIVPSFP